MNESQAYDKYSSSYDQASEAGGGGGFTVFGVFGVSGSGGVKKKLSREEFREVYRYMKSLNASTDSYDWSNSTSSTSVYASYIRDPNTIDAWRQCVTRKPLPGLYAYGSRDESENAYVQVVWSPGDFSGIAPAIDVEFPAQPTFRINPARARVAIGSGKSFAVETPNPNRALEVHVNGVYRDKGTGEELGSFSTIAKIPPAELPIIAIPDDCEQPRMLAYLGGSLSKTNLDAVRTHHFIPVHEVDGDASSRIVAFIQCEPPSR